MIDTVKRLCRLLESSFVSAEQAAESLGAITAVSGDNVSLTVKPSDPTVSEALVVRSAESEEPAYVELVPSEGTAPTVAELEASFGGYTRTPRVHSNSPHRIIFYPRSPFTSHTCAIIAEVSPGERGLEDGQTTRLTVRRDVRLD